MCCATVSRKAESCEKATCVTQSAHSFWPPAGCTVPALHSLCVNEPVEQEEPAGQMVH